MSNSPTAGQVDALIQRMADFHTETAPNGVETICIKNCREIAEEIAALYARQQPQVSVEEIARIIQTAQFGKQLDNSHKMPIFLEPAKRIIEALTHQGGKEKGECHYCRGDGHEGQEPCNKCNGTGRTRHHAAEASGADKPLLPRLREVREALMIFREGAVLRADMPTDTAYIGFEQVRTLGQALATLREIIKEMEKV